MIVIAAAGKGKGPDRSAVCSEGHTLPPNESPKECPTCRELRLQEERERRERLARKKRREARQRVASSRRAN